MAIAKPLCFGKSHIKRTSKCFNKSLEFQKLKKSRAPSGIEVYVSSLTASALREGATKLVNRSRTLQDLEVNGPLEIEHNDFSYRKQGKPREVGVATCNCTYNINDPDRASGSRCLTGLTETESVPGPCGNLCRNQGTYAMRVDKDGCLIVDFPPESLTIYDSGENELTGIFRKTMDDNLVMKQHLKSSAPVADTHNPAVLMEGMTMQKGKTKTTIRKKLPHHSSGQKRQTKANITKKFKQHNSDQKRKSKIKYAKKLQQYNTSETFHQENEMVSRIRSDGVCDDDSSPTSPESIIHSMNYRDRLLCPLEEEDDVKRLRQFLASRKEQKELLASRKDQGETSTRKEEN